MDIYVDASRDPFLAPGDGSKENPFRGLAEALRAVRRLREPATMRLTLDGPTSINLGMTQRVAREALRRWQNGVR